MSDESPSKSKRERPATDPTRLHKALGVLAVIVFLASYLIDMLPGYTVRPTLAILLALAFLTLLGFGHIVGIVLELYGPGRNR